MEPTGAARGACGDRQGHPRSALCAAARELARGDPFLTGAAEFLFTTPSEENVRDFAARWQAHSPAAAEILCLFLEDAEASSSVRAAVVEALAECGGRSVAPRIIALFGDSDPLVRHRAGWVVGSLGDASLVPAIAPMLASSDWGTRRAAVLALNLLRAGSSRLIGEDDEIGTLELDGARADLDVERSRLHDPPERLIEHPQFLVPHPRPFGPRRAPGKSSGAP